MTIRLYNKIRKIPEHLWPEYVKPILKEYFELQEKCESTMKTNKDV